MIIFYKILLFLILARLTRNPPLPLDYKRTILYYSISFIKLIIIFLVVYDIDIFKMIY
jgi:hypothetical protein